MDQESRGINFAITGVGGFVAPRHLKAIHDTGNRLVAALDPKDSVGILDSYGYNIRYFTEFERFDRHLEKLRHGPKTEQVQFISICSPNYLHDAHCRLALRIGADVICEKPLVINPWNLDQLQNLESEFGRQIYTVLQLRLHPEIIKLRQYLLENPSRARAKVVLTYITARGPWYKVSWKGDEEKSGGLAMNIGIHFFDLLLWLFGPIRENSVYLQRDDKVSGFLDLEYASVCWFLSTDFRDLPFQVIPGQQSSYRSLTINGKEINFTGGFIDLHTRVYEQILAGSGFNIEDARPSIELVHDIRQSPLRQIDDFAHPILFSKK